MSLASDFRMPGAYHFESATPTASSLGAGLFRPPASPSASSYNLTRSTGSLRSDIPSAKTPSHARRKQTAARDSPGPGWRANPDADDERVTASGRHIRYTLAGQIDATPGRRSQSVEHGILEDSMYSDIDYRRALGTKRTRDEFESPTNRHIYQRPDLQKPKTPAQLGWNQIPLQILRHVVGRVWNLCQYGAFRGFRAGHGRGSRVDDYRQSPSWGNEHCMAPPYYEKRAHDEMGKSHDQLPHANAREVSTPETRMIPAVKRRQTSENDGIGRNWVMVDSPQRQADMRPASRASIAPLRLNVKQGHQKDKTYETVGERRISALTCGREDGKVSSISGRSSLQAGASESPTFPTRKRLSLASPRSLERSRIPVSTPSSSSPIVKGPVTPSRSSLIPSPIRVLPLQKRRPSSSTASMRRSRGEVERHVKKDIGASPRLSAEAKQLAHEKLAAEKDVDMRMDAFSANVKHLIRQAREALGTQFEVTSEENGGWEDET